MRSTLCEKHIKPGSFARLFCGLIVCAVISAPSIGLTQAAAVESLGSRSCSDLLASRDNDETLYAGFGAWISGYLTAANAYEPNTFDLTPWQPPQLVTAQIATACASNPDISVAQAAVSYVTYLRGNRMTEPSRLLRVNAGGRALFIYESVLADVREVLTEKGQSITDPDGTYGESFGNAMLLYQRESELTETGLPDTPTLIKLFADRY